MSAMDASRGFWPGGKIRFETGGKGRLEVSRDPDGTLTLKHLARPRGRGAWPRCDFCERPTHPERLHATSAFLGVCTTCRNAGKHE